MEHKRIIHVSDVVEAGLLINRDFADQFPIPLRGAIASMTETIDLSYSIDGQSTELKVKGIEQILNDGTELDFDANFGWTRVDYFPKRVNWAFVYAQNRGRIDYWAKRTDIDDKSERLLKPIILVYKESLLTRPDESSGGNMFAVKLPQSLSDRSKAIMKIYVNNTETTEDWSETPF
jgi:hypothetical protein